MGRTLILFFFLQFGMESRPAGPCPDGRQILCRPAFCHKLELAVSTSLRWTLPKEVAFGLCIMPPSKHLMHNWLLSLGVTISRAPEQQSPK